MREIKFRAWSERLHRFIGVWGVYQHDGGAFQSGPFSGSGEPYVNEQFTGLHDKNGKEIYEGDIISGGLLAESCEVMYQESCGRFIAFGEHYKVLAHRFDQFEITGTIHENPELING